ncbi:MAG: hypothetical protein HQM14_06955 [SAR324 cluster bacterium]|nr:hypothetical protein [SAR324 cluster bacterium]
MQKAMIGGDLRSTDFDYRTFHQNLQEKLSPQEINSLNVLGKDFFTLIDHIVTELLVGHTEDHRLLELPLQEFLWELQIFANQFVRGSAGSIMKLRSFCQACLIQLRNEQFYSEFMEEVCDAYTEYFFVRYSDATYLV